MTSVTETEAPSLEGKLLVAMPTMGDPRFERTVIYMCAHSPEGAMGLVVNRPADHISFPELLGQLGIEADAGTDVEDIKVLSGGPVEAGRGFVLHSDDYTQATTMEVGERVALTATVDILRAIATGHGPRQCLFALGYAGWGPGQLDAEIQANGWLHVDADPDLLFSADFERKWGKAIAKLGFDIAQLSGTAGRA
ncbi:YqgE/AlgH family protein [Zavarzinia compransoris]|uniref:YqgE/AlgH family protein n=1 Tax=Zavarzinia marina TaxID=2911065 RepID=UPI001F2BF3D7|nr:YqgE/AlgH family protein [Zavarzinia marina]MCF4166532.1 YqgE/AlgH family protein [Zavarzinia marina]